VFIYVKKAKKDLCLQIKMRMRIRIQIQIQELKEMRIGIRIRIRNPAVPFGFWFTTLLQVHASKLYLKQKLKEIFPCLDAKSAACLYLIWASTGTCATTQPARSSSRKWNPMLSGSTNGPQIIAVAFFYPVFHFRRIRRESRKKYKPDVDLDSCWKQYWPPRSPMLP